MKNPDGFFHLALAQTRCMLQGIRAFTDARLRAIMSRGRGGCAYEKKVFFASLVRDAVLVSVAPVEPRGGARMNFDGGGAASWLTLLSHPVAL